MSGTKKAASVALALLALLVGIKLLVGPMPAPEDPADEVEPSLSLGLKVSSSFQRTPLSSLNSTAEAEHANEQLELPADALVAGSPEHGKPAFSAAAKSLPVQSNQLFWLQACWAAQQIQLMPAVAMGHTLHHEEHFRDLLLICGATDILPPSLEPKSAHDQLAMTKLLLDMRVSLFDQLELDRDWAAASEDQLIEILSSSSNIHQIGYAIGFMIKNDIIYFPESLNGFVGPMLHGEILPRLLLDLAFQLHCERERYCQGNHPVGLLRCLQAPFGCPGGIDSLGHALSLTLTPVENDLFDLLIEQLRRKL